MARCDALLDMDGIDCFVRGFDCFMVKSSIRDIIIPLLSMSLGNFFIES